MVEEGSVFEFAFPLLAAARAFFSTRRDTALEVLALRQQVAVLKRKRPRPFTISKLYDFCAKLCLAGRAFSEPALKCPNCLSHHRGASSRYDNLPAK